MRNKSNYFNTVTYNNLCKIRIKIAQSMRNKDHLLREHTDDIQTDIVVIMFCVLTFTKLMK